MTTTNYKHFCFTVTTDHTKENQNGFNYRNELIISAYRVTDDQTFVDVVDNNGTHVHMSFLDDEVGTSHKIAIDDVSFTVTFESIEDDKRLLDCIQLGGRKIKVDID